MLELRSLLLEIAILVGAWLCLAVLQRDPSTQGRRTFALATGAWAVWCFSYLALAEQWFEPRTTLRLGNAGSLLLAPLWLGLAAQTARLEIARRVPWFPLLLLAPGLGILALSFSERWYGLFALPGASGLSMQPGPLWPSMVVYCFSLASAGCVIFLRTALRWHQPDEVARRLAIGAAPLVTLIGSALYYSGHWTPAGDPTPLLFGVTLFLLYGGIFDGGLLQPLAISQCALIQQLPVGVVLTDQGGVVVDVNRVAERLLGVTAHTAIGRNFDAVIDAADAGIEFEVTPVRSGGTEAGQIVLLDPVGKPEAARDSLAADSPNHEARLR